MALNWQDVAQVRFQDTTQAAKNLSDSFKTVASPLQDVLQTQTDDRQNALDSSVSRMAAQASGMNAMSSYQDTMRKMTPEYIALQNAQVEAQTLQAQSAAQKAQSDAEFNKAKLEYMSGLGNGSDWRNQGSASVTPSIGTPTSIPSLDTPVLPNSTLEGQTPSANSFFDDRFDKYNTKTALQLKNADTASQSILGFNKGTAGTYAAERGDDVSGAITTAMDAISQASVGDRTAIKSQFKSELNNTGMSVAAKRDASTAFDTRVEAFRKEEETAFNEVAKVQSINLQQTVADLTSNNDYTTIPTTDDVVASTNMTAKAANSILEPAQKLQERDIFTNKYHNDTNFAVQDENGLYRLTEAGVAEYALDIAKLENKRKHWTGLAKFEKTIQATLNVESSKKILAQKIVIAAADSKQINDEQNAVKDKVVKLKSSTYSQGKTYAKFKDINPNKIESIISTITNQDSWFRENKWMVYQAMQQIGGVDSDWASQNELEAQGSQSTWISDQDADVTVVEFYKKALQLRKQYASSPEYKTASGKPYYKPLVPFTDAKKEATSEKALKAFQKIVDDKKPNSDNTNVYGNNVLGRMS